MISHRGKVLIFKIYCAEYLLKIKIFKIVCVEYFENQIIQQGTFKMFYSADFEYSDFQQIFKRSIF